MRKNGYTFFTIVNSANLKTGIWNPYSYKDNELDNSLSDFVTIEKIANKGNINLSDFAPIEYKNIPTGELLTFSLQDNSVQEGKYYIIGEQVLLFGTMRAYLGNVLVTPKAKWLEKESPIFYPINSEFVEIIPHDKLPYFWWSYLKSAVFLQQMPTGSGGTRPRVTIDNLKQIPVSVPTLEERIKINNCLIQLAEQSWRNYIICRDIIKTNHQKNNLFNSSFDNNFENHYV
ncbi:restriction endonuclease subunit S [Anabaena sp. FACHB-1237]|uniref:restriction endonuclease subunit S n=1 Tax=Anabaena sp. FACHB-1237 TaxID=2692769 RepID=UPI0016815866|nr:restriction endonuclease subunit S [Anabaena sp. FACHB-1237]MBD2137750.1 restriction endonuclease subunit S [Anabaena sp. FACHB-1237]